MWLRSVSPALGLALLAPACGDDGGVTAPDTESGGQTTAVDSSSSGSSSSTGDSSSSSSDDAPESSSGMFEPPDAECGNGYVEGDEHCDDANADDTDECTNACQFRCGLHWAQTIAPPTGESQIDPRAVGRDPDNNVIAVGFLREVTTDQKGNETAEDDEVIAVKLDPEGTELWRVQIGEPTGDVSVASVAVDVGGDIFVSASGNGPNDNDDIFVYRLASADGDILWTHTHDSAMDTSEDRAFGIAVDPDGNVIVSGQVRVADGDDDVWTRKLDGATGDELWTETWSGAGNELYSVDNGGPVAIASDDAVYVLGQEYVDFQVLRVVLLRYASDGGVPEWTYSPMLEGGTQEYEPLDLGVDAAGDLYLTYRRISGIVNTFVVQKIDADGNELWALDQTAFASDAGEDWSIVGAEPSSNGEVVIAGQLSVQGDEAAWFETWIARRDGDGEPICQVQQQGPQESLLPSSLLPRAVAAAGNGAPLLTAQLEEEGGESLWIGRFLVN